MDEKYGKPCSPCGDVTGESRYQAAARNVLRSIFNLGKSKEVQDAEQNIQILKVVNHPVNYLQAKALYEIRTAKAQKVPSPFVKTSSPTLRKAEEYSPWNIACPDLSGSFTKQHKETKVPESDFLSDCAPCGTQGYTPCSCGNGVETCYSCQGHGNVRCGNCGGSGDVNCGTCYGSGQTSYTEYRGGGSEGPVETVTVWKPCYSCGGSGRATCGTCGGYGQLTCSTCGGNGSITCRDCGGTTKLTCQNCSGLGHFLHTVQVIQDVDTTDTLEILNGYEIDTQRYSNQKFPRLEPNDQDRLLYTIIDTAPLTELPLDRVLPTQHTQPYSLSQTMSKLTSPKKIRSAGAKYIRFLTEVYQRDVLEITYQFQGNTYYLLTDRSTNVHLMNENPYSNIAANLFKKLEGHYQNGELRSFRDTYEEFSVVSGADNITLGEADAKPMMNKIKRNCLLIPALASIAVCLLSSLFLSGLAAQSLLLVGPLSAAASAFISRSIHMRLMQDKKNLTYGILAGLGAAVSAVLCIIINLIF